MKGSWRWVGILFVVPLLLGVLPGCAKAPPAPPPPPGIEYAVGEGAKLSRVSWYVKSDVLCVDVEVQNVAKASTGFEVGVKVDDGAFFFAGPEGAKEVKAGKKLTYKTQSALNTAYPKRLAIKVTPGPFEPAPPPKPVAPAPAKK